MIWMLSITEANQNFSKVTRLVDERGSAPCHPNPGKDIILTLCYNVREGRESKI